MNITCIDPIFGEMTYKHRWFKKQSIMLFKEKWNIIISAMAYNKKPITEAERQAYADYMKNEFQNAMTIEEQLKNYINNNLVELTDYWPEAHKIELSSDLAGIVIPRSLVFEQSGKTIFLLDCVWDEEHGIAVKLTPDIEVGPQFLFL
ncbi:MAG: hypothetical protein IKO47_09230 [Ruminococcus sp.]|nr:hypothetical protein [Ruminococcus sp.]